MCATGMDGDKVRGRTRTGHGEGGAPTKEDARRPRGREAVAWGTEGGGGGPMQLEIEGG